MSDFAAIKNSIRAMNEVTSMAEMLDHSTKLKLPYAWFYTQDSSAFTFIQPPSLTDFDTIIIDFKDSTYCADERIRRGKIIYSISEKYGSLLSVANFTFENFSCNNVKIAGTMQMTQLPFGATFDNNLPAALKNKITGNLTFTLFNGQQFSIQPNLERDYFRVDNFYTGSISGTDVNNESFTTTVTERIKKSSPFEYFPKLKGVFYNGQCAITQNTKVGKIWYGYKDTVDNYGFVEWQNSKFNFFLADY